MDWTEPLRARGGWRAEPGALLHTHTHTHTHTHCPGNRPGRANIYCEAALMQSIYIVKSAINILYWIWNICLFTDLYQRNTPFTIWIDALF